MKKKIIIAGATGLIGNKLVPKLIERNYEVIVLARNLEKAKSLFGHNAIIFKMNELSHNSLEQFENAFAFINLSGEGIAAKRWTNKQKEKILSSRVNSTRYLFNIANKLNNKPVKFLSASAVGYYGNSTDEIFTETSPAGGNFLAEVTKKWEDEVIKFSSLGIEESRIRLAVVLDKTDGALSKMLIPFKLFIGGPLGSGEQWFPWIHIYDAVEIFMFALENKISGPINAAAPCLINMNEFAQALGAILNRPTFFRVPEFVLNAVLGEASEMILEGAKVIPEILVQTGYNFKFPKVEEALKDLLIK
ncbi:MAG: TIGR01777 family oxidoreductase [Bacteroidetes bacterium]|nr:TIGR01777 family oxidoreductase [Bacteroidota bacterium]